MAPKDYVARSKAPKPKAPAPKAQLPWVRIIGTLALVIGFAVFLWNIKDKAQQQPQPTQSTSSKKSTEGQLPVLEKDDYGYPVDLEKEYQDDRLPSGETLAVRQHDSSVKLIMQCGSFRKLKQAQEMEARIAFQGLDAQIRMTEGQSGKWYRVYLGPYTQKRQADVDKAKIKKAGVYTCEVWNWNI